MAIRRYVGFVALTIALWASRSMAQCPGAWVNGPGLLGTDSAVFALAPLAGGDVIVGGIFNHAGGDLSSRIVRYSPSTGAWSSVGPSVGWEVDGLVALPNDDVIAYGPFLIARFRSATNSWSSLVSPAFLGDAPNCAAVMHNGDVLIGGSFEPVNSIPGLANLARYSPATNLWSAFGQPDRSVFGLAVTPNGDVFVVGGFATIGGIAAPGMAQCHAASGTWSPITLNIAASTVAAAPNGTVFVGGYPSTNQPICFGWYDPATGGWTYPAAQPNGYIDVITVLPTGEVAVGGPFTTVGNQPVSRIAIYSPTTDSWSSLGGGVNSTVRAIAVLPNQELVVGGFFTQAGGIPASHISQYSLGSTADFNHDGDSGTDADIDAFFACLSGTCCPSCGSVDFNGDGDIGTDADIDAFFRVLAGGSC